MIRQEFEVDLKPVWSRRRQLDPSVPWVHVPALRRTLVMAYQIAEYIAAHKLAGFREFGLRAHISSPRVTQVMNLLLLSPLIQEEILMDESPALHALTEIDIRPLFRETLWPRQEEIWRALLAA